MSKQGNQKLKLLYTLDILKKYSDEDHPINANFIAEKLALADIEAERKSIYSDILCLIDYGCDIIKVPGKTGGWFIGEREFEVPEVYLLCDAVRTAGFISKKKTRELLTKLYRLISEPRAKSIKKSVYFAADNKCANEEIYYNIDSISRAIEQNKKISFVYSSRSFSDDRQIVRNKREMTISPYALCWQGDHYYVVGNYEKYDNLLHLRLDRINGCNVLDENARPFSEVSRYKDFFDVADYTDKLFGMHGGTLCDVEFRCDRSISEQVLDRFSENIFITKVTEDKFSFKVKAAISDALVTFIINYGSRLTVTSPENLKQMVIKRAAEVLNNYNGNGE